MVGCGHAVKGCYVMQCRDGPSACVTRNALRSRSSVQVLVGLQLLAVIDVGVLSGCWLFVA